MSRLLGPFVTPWTVRRAARELLLSDRLGIYLDEIVRQQTTAGSEVERIERPRDVICRENPDRRPEEQLPALLVACPGTTEVRYRGSDGEYVGGLRLEVHAVTIAGDEDVGAETASILALGATALLLHELPAATGFSARWAGMTAADRDDGDRSRHAEAHVIEVSGVLLSDLGGPLPAGLTDPPMDQPAADPGDVPALEETVLTTTPVEEIDP